MQSFTDENLPRSIPGDNKHRLFSDNNEQNQINQQSSGKDESSSEKNLLNRLISLTRAKVLIWSRYLPYPDYRFRDLFNLLRV